MSSLRADPDDMESLKENDFQWIGQRGAAATQYGAGWFAREGFQLVKNDSSDPILRQYLVGSYVRVPIRSRDDLEGEVSSYSIARIIAILQDPQDHCWVGLHYFWRWGQVHAGADVAGANNGCPRITALKWWAEMFLQAEEVTDSQYFPGSRNAVYLPSGRCRELVSAALLEEPVTVLPYMEVLQRYPGLSADEALQAYDAEFDHEREPETGARRNGFFWRYTFDHTAYAFESDPAAFGGSIDRQYLAEAARTMADLYCGAGHVSMAARAAGWRVSFGVDHNADAAASFAANSMDYPGAPFNGPGVEQPTVLHCSVEELLSRCSNGEMERGVGVGYLHFSPPCQDLSQRKRRDLKTFTGTTLMAIPKLVEALQPAFVTLEEVPGFIIHQFTRKGFLVFDQASRQQQHTQQQQHQSQQSQRLEDDEESDDDDDEAVEAAKRQGDVVDEMADELQQLNLASRKAGNTSGDTVVFHPCLLVVPQLLSCGYQVRMCILNCAQYGVPQDRLRVFLFAAKHGFQLPSPPPPRYELPESSRRILADSNDKKPCDPTLMPKGSEPATWWNVLTAASTSTLPADGQLLPPVTVAEAIGDLPPVMVSSSSSSTMQQQQQAHSARPAASWHLTTEQGQRVDRASSSGSADAASQPTQPGAGGPQQQEQQQQQQTLVQMLASIRRQALQVAVRCQSKQGHQYGLHCSLYKPQHGIMLQQLPAPVSALHPVSVFAQWCRSPHWEGQGWRGFNPQALIGHTYMGSTTALPTDGKWIMGPGDVVGTILGKSITTRASIHPAEPRFSTTLERRRFQSVPDWVTYCGTSKSVNQQIGNAVPYLVAAEVAASVLQAATGRDDGQRPPNLVGPSPEGWGLGSDADLQAYRDWWQDLVAAGRWRDVVIGARTALAAQWSEPASPSTTAAAAEAAAPPSGSGSQQQQQQSAGADGRAKKRQQRGRRQTKQQQQPEPQTQAAVAGKRRKPDTT